LKSCVGCFNVGSNRLTDRVGNDVKTSDDTPTGAGVGLEVISEKMRIVLSSVGEADGLALDVGDSDDTTAEGGNVFSISVVEADGLALDVGVVSDDIAEGDIVVVSIILSAVEADGLALDVGVISEGIADGRPKGDNVSATTSSTSDPTVFMQPK
jgi:hypothetical protein